MDINKILHAKNIDCILIPSGDEFISEYVSMEHNLLYIMTGFSGSNGIAAMFSSKQNNILFTDGRYILQAGKQLDPTKWDVVDTVSDGLIFHLKQLGITRIGILAEYFTQSYIESLEQNFNLTHFNKQDCLNLFSITLPSKTSIIYHHQLEFSGEDTERKITRIQKNVQGDGYFISDPASICWLLNIRGHDVPNTPFINCVAFLPKNSTLVHVFGSFDQYGKYNQHTILYPNEDVEKILMNFESISLSKNQINGHLYRRIVACNKDVIDAKNPIILPKSIKNSVEIQNIVEYHNHDGKAVDGLIDWIKLNQGNINELDVVEKAEELRSEINDFQYPSFNTIAGFNENGAIIHYQPNEQSNKRIYGDGILLIDSGGQYLGCTTDITRTIAIGNPSKIFPQIKLHYTSVLKALIMLSELHFPTGTTGGQIDAIARYNIWKIGLDYAHGTGHGVGCFLSVHEGPCSIGKSKMAWETKLQPGMVLSIEPGIYLEGKYGIRLENLVYVTQSDKFEGFLKFETLTKAKFDQDLIEYDLLEAGN